MMMEKRRKMMIRRIGTCHALLLIVCLCAYLS
ncbi:hypothetical protein CSUI_005075 [Cystoisospora suis]|uniref:Uncharacterized protein n=1 Tax=Cystoisospora suis TaxID=483139 RepID=A0A2C6KYR4_9APIC|nr:hypothetical protein CSUI_005075 [Cystoisospora suis]